MKVANVLQLHCCKLIFGVNPIILTQFIILYFVYRALVS